MRSPVGAMLLMLGALWACDDDDGLTEADRLGVGAECASDADCLREGDAGVNLRCLTQFKGGYCGLEDCDGNEDCPEQSACVAHEDGRRYCFRSCVDKPECNVHRGTDDASNCSANVTYVDEDTRAKACVPPSAD